MSVSRINLADTDIYYTPLAEGVPRRAAEQAAVTRLLAAAGLPGPLAHHENGAPYLPSRPDLCVSISHSRRIAALAVSTQPVGIDVEELRANLPRVLPRVLSADELETWVHLPLHAWTAKEALYKAALTPGLDFRTQITLAPACPDDAPEVAAGNFHSTTTARATVNATPYTIHYLWLPPTLLALATHRERGL